MPTRTPPPDDDHAAVAGPAGDGQALTPAPDRNHRKAWLTRRKTAAGAQPGNVNAAKHLVYATLAVAGEVQEVFHLAGEFAPSCTRTAVVDAARRAMREIVHDAWPAIALVAQHVTSPPYLLEGPAVAVVAAAAGADLGWLAAIHGPTLDAIADAVTG